MAITAMSKSRPSIIIAVAVIVARQRSEAGVLLASSLPPTVDRDVLFLAKCGNLRLCWGSPASLSEVAVSTKRRRAVRLRHRYIDIDSRE